MAAPDKMVRKIKMRQLRIASMKHLSIRLLLILMIGFLVERLFFVFIFNHSYNLLKDMFDIVILLTISFPFLYTIFIQKSMLIKQNRLLKKKAELIAENEKRYSSLITKNPDLICSLDLAYHFLEANPAVREMTGFDENEILFRPFTDLVVEEDRDKVESNFKRVITTKESAQYEIRVYHKKGDIVYLSVKNVPIDVDGSVSGIFVIAKDITEKIKTEAQLEEARIDLQNTVRNQLGLTCKFKKENDRFIHTMADGELLYRIGLTPEKVVGNDPAAIVGKEQAERKIRYYEKAWSGRNVTFEYTFNGTTLLESLRPLKKDGKVSEVIVSCVDITERKKMEKSLKEAEAKYRKLVEKSLVGVYLYRGNRFVYANPRLEELTGYSKEELLQMEPIQLVADEDRQYFRQKLIKRLADDPGGEALQIRINRKDGTVKYVETLGTVTRFEGRKAIIGTVMDITDRKRSEELMIKSEKLAVIGELAAGVAHEIRNPLTSVQGFLQLLNTQDSKAKQFYPIMKKELERINFIVSELMVLARPQKLHYEKIDILDVLDNVITLLNTQAIMNNVVIHKRFESDIPPIRCEENQMKQVFINILKNAIESMPNGGRVVIEVKVPSRGEVSIRFHDEGCGIPKDRLNKLGEPFYTTKEKGTGLGLMVSQKIIKDHRGVLHVDSVVDEGTTVEVVLPVNMKKAEQHA